MLTFVTTIAVSHSNLSHVISLIHSYYLVYKCVRPDPHM